MIAPARTFGLVLVTSALAAASCAGAGGVGGSKAATSAAEAQGAISPKEAPAAPKAPAPAAKPLEPPPKPADAEDRPKEPPLKPAHAGARVYAAKAGKDDARLVANDSLRAGILKDAIALARREGRPRPQGDPRLDAAMNDLAHNLRGDDLPSLEVIDFLLTHYGIAEPSPHLLLSRATPGADREIRAQVKKQIEAVYKTSPVSRIGVGVDRAGDLMYAVVGLQESHVSLAKVPRRLESGASTAVQGKLTGRYRDARVVVTSPDGKVTEQEPSARKGQVRGKVACATGGKYQVEVMAEDVHGTAVLANFPIYCAVEPPALAPRAAGTHVGRASAEHVEKDVLALVNRDRVAAGLPPVVWDDRLAAIARAHSRDMAEHDFVGHVSPRTGTALDRVHKGGLTPEVVLENVALAFSAQEVESGFMSSPGHRANVVEPRATRIGIGVVQGTPVSGAVPLYFTQVFTN
jgi:uncharacterized protein YkwD